MREKLRIRIGELNNQTKGRNINCLSLKGFINTVVEMNFFWLIISKVVINLLFWKMHQQYLYIINCYFYISWFDIRVLHLWRKDHHSSPPCVSWKFLICRHGVFHIRYAVRISAIQILCNTVWKSRYLKTQKLNILINFSLFWNHFSSDFIIMNFVLLFCLKGYKDCMYYPKLSSILHTFWRSA